MRELINEKLKELASSKQHIDDITEIMTKWDSWQLSLEKTMFDSLNNSDRILNLSKEGRQLSSKLFDYCNSMDETSDNTALSEIKKIIEETKTVFSKLVITSKEASELSHKMEEGITFQRQASDEFIESVNQIKVNLDDAVACAEFLLTEI